jgi:hypothetical protein
MCDILDDMGHEGEGKAEAAVALGISRETFLVWQDEHPEFSDAVKDFVQRSQAWWEKKGRQHTFDKGEGFNATSYIFNMKNRFPDDWKDKQEVDNNHNVADPFAALLASVANTGKRITDED